MTGGAIHDGLIIATLERELKRLGATTRRQAFVSFKDGRGFIDLVAEGLTRKLAIEVELSPARVEADLHKAMAVEADALWIVAPNHRTALVLRRRLRSLHVRVDRGGLFVLTLGQALKRLANYFP